MAWLLKEIRMYGFKSFHRRTKISLHPGLTAIIGSNGCGKTNIADAIRFAMGEMRPHQLRVENLEDIIFSGTSLQPPLSVSEVMLEFEENQTGNAFSITRRITRGGEGEYRIDGQLSRLKDIQRKLETIGISSHRGVVVELRQMDEVLFEGSKLPRQLVEEGCGLAPFLERRLQSENKLNDAFHQLDKLTPRIEQMREELLKLQDQALKAQKWKRLKASLDFALTNELWADVREQRKTFSHLQSELKKLSFEVELQREVQELSTKIEANEIRFNVLETQWENLTNQLFMLSRSKEDAQHRLNKLEMERVRIETKHTASGEELKQIELEFQSVATDPTTTLYDDYQKMKRECETTETELTQIEQQRNVLNQKKTEQQKILQEFHSQVELIHNRIHLYETELARYKKQFNELPELQIIHEDLITQLSNQLAINTNQETLLSHQYESIQSKFSQHQVQLKDSESKLNQVTRSLEVSEREYHKYKRVLEERYDLSDELRDLLAQYPKQFQLSRDQAGEISHLLHRILGTERIQVDETILSELVKKAIELEIRSEWTTAIQSIETVPLEILLRSTPPNGVEWIAIEGITKNASGILRTVGASDVSVPIGLPEQVQTLFNEYQKLFGEKTSIEQIFGTIQASTDQTRTELQLKQQELDHCRNERINVEQRLRSEQQTIETKKQANLFLENEKSRIQQIMQQTTNQVNSLKKELNQKHVPSITLFEIELSDLDLQFEKVKSNSIKHRHTFHQIELNLRLYEMQIEQRKKRRQAIELRKKDLVNEGIEYHSKHSEVVNQIVTIREELHQLSKQETELSNQRSSLQTERTEYSTTIKELRTHYEEKRNQFEQVRTEVLLLNEKIHATQQLLNQKTKEAEESGPEPKETFRIGIEEIQRLTKRLESLEPINHLADQEFQQIQLQIRELESESDEIKRAAEIHRNSVEEAVKQATELLTISRIRIQDHFADIISKLFPGGEASLEWGEGDLLTQAPLLLRVSPRGKKIRSLRALSGGERALVALAFLVAVLNQQRPPPYLVLDEVDAPLDEENTLRFLNWLLELTEQTQVLLLTHNRQSIAVSKAWVGVTMPEAGVSQVVKVIPQLDAE